MIVGLVGRSARGSTGGVSAGIGDSVETGSHLCFLSGSKGLDLSLSIKLSAELFVGTNKGIELMGQTVVLVLENGSMVFERLEFASEIVVLVRAGRVDSTLVGNIVVSSGEVSVASGQASVGLLNLSGHIGITDILAVNVLTKVTVILGAMIVVALEGGVFSVELCVQVFDAMELTLTVF